MADIKDQLIKDSYNYVLQSDLSTGVVYRIGGSIPVNPIFSSGLTINGDFNYSNGTEQPGYVLTTNGSGYSYWNAVSGSSGISGSGTSNYLPKWSGSTSLVNSLVYDSSTGVTIGTGFTWDNTNSRLGIGTTSPTYKFEVRDTGSSSVTHFLKFRNDNNDYGGITIGSGSGQDLTIQQNTGYGYLATSGFRIGSANGIIWTNNGSIFRIVDPATEATNYLRIASTTGNVLINTGTDSGFKLDVNGTSRFNGTTTVSSDLRVNTILPIQNANLLIAAQWADSTNVTIETITNKAQVLIVRPGANLTLTSGTHDTQRITHRFQPTGGTASVNGLTLNQTINQLSGASGTTRGIYINPTISAATDFRAIETTVGNVILNSISGNTLIGTTADTGTYKLDVSGTVRLLSGGAYLTLNNATYSELGYSNNNYFRANGAAALINGPQIQFLRAGNEVGRFAGTTGNLLIGTTTDSGFKLDVNGVARVSGDITLGGSIRTPNVTNLNMIVGNFALQLSSTNPQNTSGSLITTGDITRTDSGTKNIINVNNLVSSTLSSFNILNGYAFTSNITQTQGTIRGLFIAPTLVASTDFRAIETTVGNVILNSVSGNTLIGTSTNAGYKLDVNGTARISNNTLIVGGGATSSTNALIIQNSGTTTLFYIDNSGQAFFNNRIAVNRIQPLSSANIVEIAGGVGSATGGSGIGLNQFTNVTNTSGTHNRIESTGAFLPVSGTGVFNAFQISGTINQTGGANGITRGLYINPTLTSAADYRAIETTSGNIKFGSNFIWDNTNSRLGININTPAQSLEVWGTSFVSGRVGLGSSYPIAGTQLLVTGQLTGAVIAYGIRQAGYVQNDVTLNAIGFHNRLNKTGGSTLPTYYNYLATGGGSISGTVTNQMGYAVGFDLTNATNNYAFHSELTASTGVWNLYMNGSALNHLNGSLLIGTTTDAGYKLDVNGTSRVQGATTLQGVVAVNSTNVSTGYALFVNGVIGATSLTLTQNLTMGENYAISNNGSQTIDIDANNDTTNAIFRVTANGTADELFRVNESGNFGIGTISPTQKLQVSGNTLIQGSLTANTISATTITTIGGNIVTKISSGVDSSGNTTAGAFTVLSSVIVLANTFTTGDVVSFKVRMRKSGTNGTVNYRISTNTTLSLTGSQTIGVFNAGTTIVYGELGRTLIIKGATSEVFNTSITNVQSDVTTSTSSVSSVSVDWTVNQYIMFNINQASALDTTNISYYSINKI